MELISLSDVERIESKRTVIKVMNVMKEDLRDYDLENFVNKCTAILLSTLTGIAVQVIEESEYEEFITASAELMRKTFDIYRKNQKNSL